MEGLVVILLLVVLGATVAAAFLSYRKHVRAARVRSSAALSALLAEAYLLEQQAARAEEPKPEPNDEVV